MWKDFNPFTAIPQKTINKSDKLEIIIVFFPILHEHMNSSKSWWVFSW